VNGTNLPGDESRDIQDPEKGLFGGLTLNFNKYVDIEDDAARSEPCSARAATMSEAQERV